MYTELTSLQKAVNKSVTDYIVRAETLSDGLLTAMILKGLPDAFKPFSVHIAQSDEKLKLAEFKTKLRSYESTEKCAAACSTDDSVVKVRGRENFNMKLICYSCGQKGHKALECTKARDNGVVSVRAPRIKMQTVDGEKKVCN